MTISSRSLLFMSQAALLRWIGGGMTHYSVFGGHFLKCKNYSSDGILKPNPIICSIPITIL